MLFFNQTGLGLTACERKTKWLWPQQSNVCFTTDSLEDNLLVSYKTKYTVAIKSSNHGLCYLPQEVEKHVYTNIAQRCV